MSKVFVLYLPYSGIIEALLNLDADVCLKKIRIQNISQIE